MTEALTPDEVSELLALMDEPIRPAEVAAVGRKRRKCKRTPAHPHCKSVRWARAYEALRRKGKSKKSAAQISNWMHARWMRGQIKRRAFP